MKKQTSQKAQPPLSERSEMLRTVKIRLPGKTYSVHIGAGAISKTGAFLKSVKSKRAFIIADEKLKGPRAQLLAALKKPAGRLTKSPSLLVKNSKISLRSFQFSGSSSN